MEWVQTKISTYIKRKIVHICDNEEEHNAEATGAKDESEDGLSPTYNIRSWGYNATTPIEEEAQEGEATVRDRRRSRRLGEVDWLYRLGDARSDDQINQILDQRNPWVYE